MVGGVWAGVPVRTEESVTMSPASVGVEEAGLVQTVPSGVPLGGGDPGVSTSVSVTTRPPAVLWTATVSVGRASQATGTVKSMNSWLQQKI